jgi:hypothetical protein
LLRPTGTEGAFIHLPSHAERGAGRKLRSPKGASIRTVTAPNTNIFIVQDNTFIGLIKALNRTYRHARGIRTMHTGDRDRLLSARYTVVDSYDTATINPPRNVVLCLACGYTTIAFNATLGVTDEFHLRHDIFPLLP